MTTITEIDTDTIQESAQDAEGSVTEYSGRNMYGKQCLGICFDSMKQYGIFLIYVAARNHELALSLAEECRMDDMGRGLVAYWPYVSFDGFIEDEDEDY